MTNQDSLVTVIISSYNHAPYVEQSILSVVRQTYPHIELLVIDDGSTDDSVRRIEALQRIYGFDFRVQENKGLPCTLNEAIERAQGAFIAPFGSDDIMIENRLSLQISYIADKPEVGICAGNIEVINADGSPYVKKHPKPQPPFRRLNFDDIFLERKPFAPAPTLLIRKEALQKVGGFNPTIRLEDLYIQLKIAHAGYYIDALDAILAFYRRHPTNTCRNLRFMTESILRIYQDYSEHPAYEQIRHRFINSMLSRASRRDKTLARELLSQLPLRAWNRKTLSSLLHYPFTSEASRRLRASA
jgi:alpha-1,3-rhamnosyltransferase